MNKVKPLDFALVGCGRIAKRHSELLGHGQIANARLSAVCDVKVDRARVIGEQFDVPYFQDMHSMMRSAPVDVVVVLTESGSHAAHVLELAPYRRHIVVEKPMALTLLDADRMIAACDEAGVHLFVVKQNRFNVPVVKLREALEAGRFGKLVLGTVRVRWCRPQSYYDADGWRGTWAMDGGVLANQASHHIDMLEWMMGDVDSVYAVSATRLVDIETEDTAVVTLQFRNGALGVIEATTATRPVDLEGSLSILGENGSVVIGGFAANKLTDWKFETPQPGDEEVFAKFSENPPNVYGFGHIAYLQHVVNAVTKGAPSLVDGLEGRRSLELVIAIYESMATGQVIKIGYGKPHTRLGRKA